MAAEEEVEKAGERAYHDNHMSAIFDKGFSFSGYERDLMVWNTGDRTFANVSGVSGADSISDGRGSVFADLDNDGDADILLTAVQKKAHYLLRNNIGNGRHYLRVVLRGTRSGTDAFGTVVRVNSPTVGLQAQFKAGGSGYISQNDGRLLFGLGDDRVVEHLEIVWPDGSHQSFTNLPVDGTLEFVEGDATYRKLTLPRVSLPEPWTESDHLLAHTGFRVGQSVPEIPLVDLQGKRRSWSDLRKPGTKTLVNLWATWCTSCVTEIPQLVAQRDTLAGAGIQLVGVSVDVETLAEVPEYARGMGIDYPVVTTDASGMESLFPTGESTVPLTILLDASGRVEQAWIGWNSTVEREILALGR